MTSRRNSWAGIVHSKLICMLVNMLYEVPDVPASPCPRFLIDQLDLIGGIEFIFQEVCTCDSEIEFKESLIYIVKVLEYKGTIRVDNWVVLTLLANKEMEERAKRSYIFVF